MEATETLALEPVELGGEQQAHLRCFETEEEALRFVNAERLRIIRQFFHDSLKADSSLH